MMPLFSDIQIETETITTEQVKQQMRDFCTALLAFKIFYLAQ